MKYTSKVRTIAAALITIGTLTGGANAFTALIDFDDVWAVRGDPSTFYSILGVTISGTYHGVAGGVSNGDPGNWALEGTQGPAFLGVNQGTSGNPTFTFITPRVGQIDIGVNFGSSGDFLISGSLNGSSVFAESISISDDNNGQGTWQTFEFTDFVDNLEVRLASGPTSAFGLDNVRLSTVPELSSILLLGLGGLASLARRRRAN